MYRKHKTTLAVIALQLLVAFACAADASASDYAASGSRTSGASSVQRRRGRPRRDALLPGMWGGEHLRFEVTQSGATMEFDCAHGTVDGKINVDRAGRFSVWGTFYPEHGGPTREGAESRGERVRLTGRVGGSIMKLTITRGKTQLGTYALTRDGGARIFKCR